jgi:glycerol kinase
MLVLVLLIVAVTRGAIKWLWDTMKMIKAVNEINVLARLVLSASGVYSVTAFSGLFVPYLDPGVTGFIVGLMSYTTPVHIVHAMLQGDVFPTYTVIESMKLDSNSELDHLKVDGP